MFYTIKFRNLSGFINWLLITASVLMLILTSFNMMAQESFKESTVKRCLVIDPGHGGVDSGAIALNGTRESDLNLAIGLKLQALADFIGVKAVMTRADDSMRTDMKSYSEHDELVYRTKIANSTPNAVLISIHQNCYPTSQPSGAQVLYAKSDGSRSLGEISYNNILNFLEPENRRVLEPAPKSLYITANVTCPAILVECGFISNFSDLEKLSDKEYQTAFASVLMGSFLQFTNTV